MENFYQQLLVSAIPSTVTVLVLIWNSSRKFASLELRLDTVEKDLSNIRTEFKSELKEIRAEIKEVRDELRLESKEIRQEISKTNEKLAGMDVQINMLVIHPSIAHGKLKSPQVNQN